MTDTVNVPREALEKAVAVIQHLDPSLQDVGEASFRDLVGSLAAAPKAEACALHKVHGIHLDPCCPYCPEPEAPKVEQEPVGGYGASDSVARYYERLKGKRSSGHPAPASDELLSIVRVASAALQLCAEGYKPEETAKRALEAIAKHKGPQS